jgi:hypothetical protein
VCTDNINISNLFLCAYYRISFIHISYSGERMSQIFQMHLLSFVGNRMAQPLNSTGQMPDLCYVMVPQRFYRYLHENVMNCIISCILDLI